MGALQYTVYVTDPTTREPVPFGPDSEDIPDWALEQMGDHCFVDGERPDAADSGEAGGYSRMKKAELEAEVANRNEDRDEDAQIVVEGKGNVPDLIAALEADDAAHQG